MREKRGSINKRWERPGGPVPSEASRAVAPVSEWARGTLGFCPDEAQAAILDSGARRGIVVCSRQWGKSTVAAVMGLAEMVRRPGALVLVVSKTETQAGELLQKMRGFAVGAGLKSRGGQGEMRLPNGSRAVVATPVPGSVRCYSAVSLILLDEAAYVEDALYDAVRPMLAVSNGRLWLFSTPNGQRGFFWKEWERAGKDWFRISVTALECPRIGKEFLEEEKDRYGETGFAQEYLCNFRSQGGMMFSPELLERMFT